MQMNLLRLPLRQQQMKFRLRLRPRRRRRRHTESFLGRLCHQQILDRWWLRLLS
jgi:hypothetical protein